MLLLWLACTPAPPPAVPSPLDDSWVGQIVSEPQRFEDTISADRDAWVALHANRWSGAHRDQGAAASRSQALRADLALRVAHIESQGWERTLALWEQRGNLPQGSALPWFAALALLESGGDPAPWLMKVDGHCDPMVQEAARTLIQHPSVSKRMEEVGENPLIQRFDAHLSAREGASDTWPTGIAHSEDIGGVTRQFADPQLPWTLAVVLQRQDQPTTGLPALLFSDCLDESTCGADAIAALGVDPALGPVDSPDQARAIVRGLDEVLDAWSRDQRQHAPDAGQALLAELQLIPKLRAQLLLSLADEALAQEHPRQALALAQASLDLAAPRRIGPVNSPTHFAVLAQAHLETGHTREALDALEVLAASYPEAAGADEIVGDLSVLQGLDRQGDSKEN
ncbi:MAG: hypothetical protein VX899_25535 [Myxococcota bacterium]|nr:hypothetical protein [Myxococcota bacterium]